MLHVRKDNLWSYYLLLMILTWFLQNYLKCVYKKFCYLKYLFYVSASHLSEWKDFVSVCITVVVIVHCSTTLYKNGQAKWLAQTYCLVNTIPFLVIKKAIPILSQWQTNIRVNEIVAFVRIWSIFLKFSCCIDLIWETSIFLCLICKHIVFDGYMGYYG